VRVPELAGLFAVFMVGYAAWLGDRYPSVAAVTAGTSAAAPAETGRAGSCRPPLAPRGACCYKLAMAIVMGYMLIVML
jgi:hypothetical protein